METLNKTIRQTTTSHGITFNLEITFDDLDMTCAKAFKECRIEYHNKLDRMSPEQLNAIKGSTVRLKISQMGQKMAAPMTMADVLAFLNNLPPKKRSIAIAGLEDGQELSAILADIESEDNN